MFEGCIYESKISQGHVKRYPPVPPGRFFALDSIELLEDMLTPLTIFDLDPRVTPPKQLQVIWCNCDVESIRRRKDCVLKSVDDIKNSSKDIL